MTNVDKELLGKLYDDAQRHEQWAKDEGDEINAEYFRGVAAGFACAITVLED